MRLPRVRFTVRGLMVFVLACGLTFHLAFAAIRVSVDKGYHSHTWVIIQGGKPFFTLASAEQPPFWPRYWRCIIGQPWKSVPLCRQVKGRTPRYLRSCPPRNRWR